VVTQAFTLTVGSGPGHNGARTFGDWQTKAVPSITGQLSPTLTVTNLARSTSWYTQLFDMTMRREYEPPDGRQRDVCLVEPMTGLEICLVQYRAGPRHPFSEFQPGLDHLEFLVANRNDLDEWAERLEALGITHSGVKDPRYTRNAMITFRDPDNIQLEFFWRATQE
jgi:glyoxylase I family protein